MIRPPKFWFFEPERHNLWSSVFYPISKIWEFETNRRIKNGKSEAMPIPVICVGNLTVGGSGKTPTIIALAKLFKKNGYKPQVISRGYGGSIKGPHLVDQINDTSKEVGDEPLLISKSCPVWVSKNKKDGILAAAKNKADLVLLDDGFQNSSIKKDLSILVIDSKIGFGNAKVLPAGPLREPIIKGVKRADFLLLIGEEKKYASFFDLQKKPLFYGKIVAKVKSSPNLKNKSIIAFSGIAHPSKFFDTLEELGANILVRESFPDHYNYKESTIRRLKNEAIKRESILITTEKDFVRIPKYLRENILALCVELIIANEKPLISIIKKHLVTS